jgi:hypothetical protein
MNRCLSDQALLQCYTGEGAADELAHLKSCLACAGRFKSLEGDMSLITQALQAPPPWHNRAPGWSLSRWRMAIPLAAAIAAFVVGWSLRGVSFNQLPGRGVPIAAHAPTPSGAAIQVSALEPASAIYAAYVQDEFGGDSCSDMSDPLGPGCQ